MRTMNQHLMVEPVIKEDKGMSMMHVIIQLVYVVGEKPSWARPNSKPTMLVIVCLAEGISVVEEKAVKFVKYC